ncbi:MAG: peptidoglycan DD-metalloendopeptidase family protein [Proteobacteria bacterium]|nr:peptidoglycan DD-metalloendopeptidase family protein [Pseudomonadota bacterium]
MSGLLALQVALFLTFCAEAQQELDTASANLEKIRVAVDASELEIERIQGEFASLLARRKEITDTIKRLKLDDQLLETKLQQVEQEHKVLIVRVQEAEERVAETQEKNNKRLRFMYIQRVLSSAPLELRIAKQGQLERVSAYARSVRHSDQERFMGLQRVAKELLLARKALDLSIFEARRLRDEIQVRRRDAELKQKELKLIAKEIVSRREQAQRSLKLLKREANELERVVISMTSESPDEASTDSDSQQDEEGPKELIQPEGSIIINPRGLFGASGGLAAPVKGQVMQRFGKVQLASFKDVLFSKGVEFSTKEGGDVHAVLGGKIAYAGNLPGYDTVVIIDHGVRSYSLYGRLGSSLVNKGDIVTKDHVVGVTAAPDKRGRNFYFEVRKNGAPVDPEAVLPQLSR